MWAFLFLILPPPLECPSARDRIRETEGSRIILLTCSRIYAKCFYNALLLLEGKMARLKNFDKSNQIVGEAVAEKEGRMVPMRPKPKPPKTFPPTAIYFAPSPPLPLLDPPSFFFIARQRERGGRGEERPQRGRKVKRGAEEERRGEAGGRPLDNEKEREEEREEAQMAV